MITISDARALQRKLRAVQTYGLTRTIRMHAGFLDESLMWSATHGCKSPEWYQVIANDINRTFAAVFN